MGSSQSTINSYDLSNKVVIITGSTDGIGKSLARIISSYNPKRLILPVRNKKKGELLLEYIKESQDGNGECIELWDMDLADLHSVKNFADKFIKEVGELHYLWNNAGIYCTGFEKTKDNFEQQFQINHLSHFLLTSLLLPTIKNSATPEFQCKIIHTTSKAQVLGKIDFDNLNGEKSYSGYLELYSNSKLMNIIYSNELNHRLKDSNVTSTACHPGIIPTNNTSKLMFWFFIRLFSKSPDIGAINVMYPALDPNIDEGGKYFEECEEAKPIDQALDEDLAKKFWEKSEELLNNYDASLLK
ncbi:NADP-binding protein [Gigaspora margarita]|uniref:NADP-binding protein n=1 Tax=Gigaspora margarita TaxID=4874 RepID=A0A8H3XIN6_GIGMA|nr:NADP-binding protein [Gigaspora margarita]